MNTKFIILILITLLFFSSNSILVRMAFLNNSIDPYSFTFLRLFFGALTLIVILYFKEKKLNFSIKQNWLNSFMLFIYALCFSYAYINLDAGLGALILFAIVQFTIITIAIIKKEKLTIEQIVGIFIAFIGLIYLLYPSKETEISIYHFLLMTLSGIGWGIYTVLGKTSNNPVFSTTDNFLKTIIYLFLFYIFFIKDINISSNGVLLAFLSGGITSYIGYVLWYYLLPNLKITTSGVLQLLIPPITIFLGVIFLGEEVTFKLIISTTFILIGILIYLKGNKFNIQSIR
ncbi:DMT family transporter [Aliarcobacter butzleri]